MPAAKRKINRSFAVLVEQRVAALVQGSDPFFFSRRQQIVALAAHHAMPTIYPDRESVAEGGLMSYGNNIADAYRRAGNYATRIVRVRSQPICPSGKPCNTS